MPILKKLLTFQKQEIVLTKDGKNPHFKSKYATLNEVLSKVKKPLNELGVLIIQEPKETGLLTRLIDTEDDSEVTGFMPYVEVTNAQKLGSSNTYNRRYLLVTLLGLEDEDDDGNVASGMSHQPQGEYYEPVAGADNICACGKPIKGNYKQCWSCKNATQEPPF